MYFILYVIWSKIVSGRVKLFFGAPMKGFATFMHTPIDPEGGEVRAHSCFLGRGQDPAPR